jgi:hypothetical protein
LVGWPVAASGVLVADAAGAVVLVGAAAGPVSPQALRSIDKITSSVASSVKFLRFAISFLLYESGRYVSGRRRTCARGAPARSISGCQVIKL